MHMDNTVYNLIWDSCTSVKKAGCSVTVFFLFFLGVRYYTYITNNSSEGKIERFHKNEWFGKKMGTLCGKGLEFRIWRDLVVNSFILKNIQWDENNFFN